METKPLIIERIYDTPVQKAWDAITNKEQMKEWYFDLKEFKPEKGFKFHFTCQDEHVIYMHACEVVDCDVLQRISYTWTYPGLIGCSLLTWELFREPDDKTRLKLTHAGLESFPQGVPSFSLESFAESWQQFLDQALPSFLEKKMYV